MADRIIKAHPVREGWFDIVSVKAEIAGEEIEREIVRHPSGAAVLPYDPERRVALMIAQTRPPMLYLGEPRMLEAIAGALDEDEPETCARREALEEGGLRLRALDHVASLWATPATSTEQVHYFLAEYGEADRVARGGGLDEEEEHLGVCDGRSRLPLAQGGGEGDTRRKDLHPGPGSPSPPPGPVRLNATAGGGTGTSDRARIACIKASGRR
ncbi:MAG TPA: NUDIX domain-containing protein [Allosphingosinicella sp.]|nr:NUDIX domain-containing protein [Allosphingosinicella sp.]